MKCWSLLIWLLCLAQCYMAQSHQLSGYIQDAASGEMLLGATVWCASEQSGTGTNAFGFYSLSLPSGKHELTVSYIGYTPQSFEVDVNKDLKLDFELSAGVAIDEAVVTGESFNRIEDQVQMSKMEIPMEQVRRLPAIGGEVDLLKSLQLMPGVQSGGEGTSGLYVRGGSPDQNLIVLDGVPLYSVSHLFGFFSVFNSDAVKQMTITKGGFPARFGGRLSSVLEVNMKDGNMREVHGTANVSVLASKFMVEGPIVKDKASFMLSGRRTYLDLLVNPIIASVNSQNPEIQTDPRYFFYDLNGKVNWRIGTKDRVYLSFFNGTDDFGLASTEKFGSSSSSIDFGLDWFNSVGAARWNHEWTPKLFSNLTLTRSEYAFNTGIEFSETENLGSDSTTQRFASLYQSGIIDYAARMDFNYALSNAHYLRFGGNVTWHQFNPGATTFQAEFGQSFPSIDTTLGSAGVESVEQFLFIEDEIQLADRFKANIGLHGALLNVNGASFGSLQPRVALNFQLRDGSAIKASYARMNQFVHLLTNEGLSLPTDLWVPATDRVDPQSSAQWAAGWAKTFGELECSVEGYYKTMDGLLSYKEGASFSNTINADWEEQVTQGQGTAYGFEFLLQKKHGRTTGWVGYTLSWAERQFDEINSGNWFPYTYDRRHDASVVLMHRLSDRVDFSATWVYGTGRALTLPESTFRAFVPASFAGYTPDMYGFDVEIPSAKNAYRTSPYHRADVSLTFIKEKSAYTRSMIYSIYNVYNNLNPFFSLVDENIDGTRVIREYGIFPIIPSIAWRAEF
ncbi:MAG: TonB-dependent receptor [Bacteroidetes bacterium]|nr:TonB-dependent receptor [Bacteroidota bacterium]